MVRMSLLSISTSLLTRAISGPERNAVFVPEDKRLRAFLQLAGYERFGAVHLDERPDDFQRVSFVDGELLLGQIAGWAEVDLFRTVFSGELEMDTTHAAHHGAAAGRWGLRHRHLLNLGNGAGHNDFSLRVVRRTLSAALSERGESED